MIFTTPLALLLLLLLPLFAYLGWPRLAYRRRRDTASLTLRLLIVLLLVLGLAGTQISRAANRLAVVFLVDVSDSMDSSAQAAALDFVREAMSLSSPEDETAVILFGGDALVERPLLPGTELGAIGSHPGTLNTDLAEAIRLGTALFPSNTARRMVILSDGVVTVGDAEEAARLAAASGVQLDFVPFSRLQTPEVAVTDVQVPNRLNVDEPFEINYTIESDAETQALVTLFASGATIARSQVDLRTGENRFFFRLDSGFPQTGFSDIRIQVEPVQTAADSFYQNNSLSAFTEITGPSRVLMVARANDEGAADIEFLLPALEEVGLEVDLAEPNELPIGLAPLSAYESVILVNVPAADLSPLRMETLRTYVRDLGGGLVAVGGDQSYGVGGYYRTPLEDTLPVEMQLKDQERLPALSLIFVIDTSGSMGSTGSSGYSNLELAKEAIIRSVELLNPVDRVGVVGFNSNASWVVQPTLAEEPAALQEQIATLRSGGGTDIMAGIQAAANYLPNDPSNFKHIILLTDGGSNPSGIPELVERMRIEYEATTSVVAVGEDYAPFLHDLAAIGQGNFHFTRDVTTIPSIFTAETLLASRSYIVEEEFYPTTVSEHPILSGIRRTPPLYGYVASTPKDTAQILLRSPEPNADPLLAAWQFGLGRSVAWTSDATAKWAQEWVDWPDYPRIFSQMVRWTITEGINSNLETTVEQRGEQAVLVVDARDSTGEFLNGLALDVGIVSPDLDAQTSQLYQVAPGRYEGTFTPGEEGAYFIRVAGSLMQGAAAPGSTNQISIAQTTGWVLTYSPEYRLPEAGVDLNLLNNLANLTEGSSLVGQPDAVYEHNIQAHDATVPLWPLLLLIAALLLPFDVGVRRLIFTNRDMQRVKAWIVAKLGIEQRPPEPARTEQIDRLMDAKQRASDAQRNQPPLPSVSSAVDTILPVDERQAPTPAQPETIPAGTAAATAASLAARRRETRAQASTGGDGVPSPAKDNLPLTPSPAPADKPTEEKPQARPKPQPKPATDGSSTASYLLRRKRQRGEDQESED